MLKLSVSKLHVFIYPHILKLHFKAVQFCLLQMCWTATINI